MFEGTLRKKTCFQFRSTLQLVNQEQQHSGKEKKKNEKESLVKTWDKKEHGLALRV